jgi:hypothetical protein
VNRICDSTEIIVDTTGVAREPGELLGLDVTVQIIA